MQRSLIVVSLVVFGLVTAQVQAQQASCQPQKIYLIPLKSLIIPIVVKNKQCSVNEFFVDGRFDDDADNLPDTWELEWFLDLTTASGIPGALTDYDGDGLQDIEEFRYGLDPTVDDFTVATHFHTFQYDPIGQLTSMTTDGQTVRFAYDPAGNILTISATSP